MNGILPIWKESGWTSHDVVMKVRRLLNTRKIGHTGTLDPEVEGVLVLCIGDATKLVQFMVESDKSYAGTITLGYATETEDQTGDIVETTPLSAPIDKQMIDQAMSTLTGEIIQIPPYYSAVKVDGRRLYEYARLGQEVERPKRQVKVDRFVRTSEPCYDPVDQTQSWDFEVDCSKGTYVRTLAVDTGKQLNFASHMSRLVRTANNGFTQEDCLTISQLEQIIDQKLAVDQYMRPLSQGLKSFGAVTIDELQLFAMVHGQVVPADFFGQIVTEPVAVYYQETALGLYAPHPEKPNYLKPLRMFQTVKQWM